MWPCRLHSVLHRLLNPSKSLIALRRPAANPKATVVFGKHFQQTFSGDDVVYVNLGTAQGVKVGDYFRVFRYTGDQNEFAYQTRRMAFDVYGFGAVSKEFNRDNVPREVLGEGIVVRTSENSSSVILTFALREIYAGDPVEIDRRASHPRLLRRGQFVRAAFVFCVVGF